MRVLGNLIGIFVLALVAYWVYRAVLPGGPTISSVLQARTVAPAGQQVAALVVAQPVAAAEPAVTVPAPVCNPAVVTDHPPARGRGYSVDARGRAGAIADVWYQGSAVPRELSVRVPAGVVVDFPGANGKDWIFPSGCADADVDSHQAAHASERAEIRGVLTLEQAVEQKLAVVR